MFDRSSDYGRLVVPAGNNDEPFHRWFRMKEAYSFGLFERLIKDSGDQSSGPLRVLDPFSGSGTTAISATSLAIGRKLESHVTLIERNPVLRIVSEGKAAGLLGGVKVARAIERELPSMLEKHAAMMKSRRSISTASVTLNNRSYYPPSHTRSLLALSQAVRSVEDRDARLVLQTCVASAVEPSGRLRRDGRALRYTPERRPASPIEAFSAALDRCLEDLKSVGDTGNLSSVTVLEGDARESDRCAPGPAYDWIVFSPPYPNNIDYTEVYKTEAWTLGCFDNVQAMKSQRLATVRSHTSLYFPDEYAFRSLDIVNEVQALINPLLNAVPSDRYERGRRQLIAGYADDMLRVFQSLRKLVHAESRLVFVVGNSVHGTGDSRLVIASDILLAALAELVGWQVEEIRVARELRRRTDDLGHARESVVCLRPA
ncbi:hypothetical protein [Micromonospora sp. DT41]|uniref:hypothetical protein n=1 Tax=Micromonospora sp. DT41 TaxID=3393437 RepID=UPI003CF19DD0